MAKQPRSNSTSPTSLLCNPKVPLTTRYSQFFIIIFFMQMGKFKTWLVTRHHHNHCQHDQKFILYLKPKIRHSRERERENRVEWWHGRDKRVSITRKRNKEKVENGLSPAFPKPKMLNACITFPLQPIKVPHFGPFLFSLSQPLRE